MTAVIVTQAAAKAATAPDADGPFGDKPPAVCGAFWADPVWHVTIAVEHVLRGNDYAPGWHDLWTGPAYSHGVAERLIADDVAAVVEQAMYGQHWMRRADGTYLEHGHPFIDHVRRTVRQTMARVLDDPGSRVVGDAERGPVLLTDEPTADPAEWFDMAASVEWVRSPDYRCEYDRLISWCREAA